MDWFSVADRAASTRFGWAIGCASGLYLAAIVVLLILSAPAYRAGVPRAVDAGIRKVSQWALTIAPLALLVAWSGCGYLAKEFLSAFAVALSFGMLLVIAPLLLLLIFSAANRLGEAMAR